MGKRESAIEARCVELAEFLGCLLVKVKPTIIGWPDRLLVIPGGAVVFIEFKRPGETLRREQIDIKARLHSLGANYAVCDSLREFFWIVKTYAPRPDNLFARALRKPTRSDAAQRLRGVVERLLYSEYPSNKVAS